MNNEASLSSLGNNSHFFTLPQLLPILEEKRANQRVINSAAAAASKANTRLGASSPAWLDSVEPRLLERGVTGRSFAGGGMAEEQAHLLVDLRGLFEGLRNCTGLATSPFRGYREEIPI